MNSHWDDAAARLKAIFPESDSSVLVALADQGEAIARYVAQIHDLTLAEVIETMELMLGVRIGAQLQPIAAE